MTDFQIEEERRADKLENRKNTRIRCVGRGKNRECVIGRSSRAKWIVKDVKESLKKNREI